MDSLFGYKNDTYRDFGWAPARLDDLVNWFPARLALPIITVSAALLVVRAALLIVSAALLVVSASILVVSATLLVVSTALLVVSAALLVVSAVILVVILTLFCCKCLTLSLNIPSQQE